MILVEHWQKTEMLRTSENFIEFKFPCNNDKRAFKYRNKGNFFFIEYKKPST